MTKNDIALIMCENRLLVRKRFDRFPNSFVFNEKTYAITSEGIVPSARKRKIRYVVFRENNLVPLSVRDTDPADKDRLTHTIVSTIDQDHTQREFLHAHKESLALFIVILLFGVFMGVVIGIVIYPHIMTVAPIAHTGSVSP